MSQGGLPSHRLVGDSALHWGTRVPPGGTAAVSWADFGGFLAVAIPFALLVRVIGIFQLESPAFYLLSQLGFLAFLFHYFLRC